MTKELILSKGKVTVVDDEDYEWASQFAWHAKPSGGTFYVVRKGKKLSGGRVNIFLHREILNALRGMGVDHINGDGLDNRRSNLRIATQQENCRNRSNQGNNTSGFKGVSWHKGDKKWRAVIFVNYKQSFLGNFNTPEEAAYAYDKAAIEHFGEFAKTNRDMGLV